MRPRSIPDGESLWTDPSLDDLLLAILCTLAYADVFDYPLTHAQIHRYLVGMAARREEVAQKLEDEDWGREAVEHHGDYVTLPGQGKLVDVRRRRNAVAAEMWPSAVRYARAIAAIPFVRSVALTGALAMGNVEPGDDFDFLIITAAGRLWLTRALVIGFIVKPAARRNDEVCPNYLFSERTLKLESHNLYVAHELTQMVPLAGVGIYHRIRHVNRWTGQFLPNAGGPPPQADPSEVLPCSAGGLAEWTLSSFVGGQLERFEQRRKIRRFTASRPDLRTACFSADRCKGHIDSNEDAILSAFDQRLQLVANL